MHTSEQQCDLRRGVGRAGEQSEKTRDILCLFLKSAAAILMITGLLKIISSFQEAQVFGMRDPLIMMLTNRQLLGLTGLLEVVTAVLILRRERWEIKIIAICWLSWAFLIYRFGLGWIGHKQPCPCLGNISEWIGISPSSVGWISNVLLIYLLAGSTLVLTCHLIGTRRRTDAVR